MAVRSVGRSTGIGRLRAQVEDEDGAVWHPEGLRFNGYSRRSTVNSDAIGFGRRVGPAGRVVGVARPPARFRFAGDSGARMGE